MFYRNSIWGLIGEWIQMTYLHQWFSTGGSVASLETIHKRVETVCGCHRWEGSETRDATGHPTRHRPASQQRSSGTNGQQCWGWETLIYTMMCKRRWFSCSEMKGLSCHIIERKKRSFRIVCLHVCVMGIQLKVNFKPGLLQGLTGPSITIFWVHTMS